MINFRLVEYSIREGVRVVEIMTDGVFSAAIYPDGEKGIKIVSAHFDDIKIDSGEEKFLQIPSVNIKFNPVPYAIIDGRIVKIPKSA